MNDLYGTLDLASEQVQTQHPGIKLTGQHTIAKVDLLPAEKSFWESVDEGGLSGGVHKWPKR
ncbi:MAG: hypothetical protein M2R45_04944 [Verrucomicrobia subdivision 3 bacterium]|nr:hypothetical protein [Limisphaerales bacterium]MCS1415619.1 hypothetical protein [Limisphaerales bacterium]